jgi:Na+/H+ antiporter NhaD/arsenite permease-like protein
MKIETGQCCLELASGPTTWLILIMAAGLAWVLSANFGASLPALDGGRAEGCVSTAPPGAIKVLVALLFGVIYLLAYQPWTDYPILFALGAIAAVFIGDRTGFYTVRQALSALTQNFDVLAVLAGMNLVTAPLALGGWFDHLGRKVAGAARGDPWLIMVWFCTLTYAISLWVNNLTTMMILAPMVITLSRRLGFDAKPYLIGMVVASNLGGASTMVGAFPNVLIASKAGLGFDSFIYRMLPVCLILLLVLLAYMRLTQYRLWTQALPAQKASARRYGALFSEAGRPRGRTALLGSIARGEGSGALPAGRMDLDTVRRGIVVLALVLAGFFACGRIGCKPAYVALAGGLAAIAWCGPSPERVIQELSLRNLLFFAALFVLVGAAKASGVLESVGSLVTVLSCGNGLARCLLLMWLAAAATAFLNAGPSTALFLPLALSWEPATTHHLLCWSLSLGVLAGSSATLTGATAGSLVSAMLSREPGQPAPARLGFAEYARCGAPLALIFLLISSVYVSWLYVRLG